MRLGYFFVSPEVAKFLVNLLEFSEDAAELFFLFITQSWLIVPVRKTAAKIVHLFFRFFDFCADKNKRTGIQVELVNVDYVVLFLHVIILMYLVFCRVVLKTRAVGPFG